MISDVVDHTLDLSVILASYTEARGAPPFDPRLMLKVLIYGYATGVCSSRKLEARCHDRVLALCERAGLVKLGRVALDGTKVRASASRREAMSYDRMGKREARLAAEIAELEAQAEALVAEAEDTDAAEDARCGPRPRLMRTSETQQAAT